MLLLLLLYICYFCFSKRKNINDKGDTSIWTVKIQVAQFELGCRIWQGLAM